MGIIFQRVAVEIGGHDVACDRRSPHGGIAAGNGCGADIRKPTELVEEAGTGPQGTRCLLVQVIAEFGEHLTMQQVHGLAQVECPAAVHCGRGHSSTVVALRATAHQRGHFDFRKAAVGGLPRGIQGGDLSIIHFRELPAECLRETRAVLVLVGVPPPILIPAVKNAAAVFFGQMVHHELGEPNRPLGIFGHMQRHPRLGCPVRRLKLR